MFLYLRKLCSVLIVVCIPFAFPCAQSSFQPPNIDFSTGTFQNWQCYTGFANSFQLTPPQDELHRLIPGTNKKSDHFGKIPVAFPGGKYTLKLGTSDFEDLAERVAYTFTIPPGVNDYTLIYHYALVFSDKGPDGFKLPPQCIADLQMFFRVRLHNLTDNTYMECGSAYVNNSQDTGYTAIDFPVLRRAFVKPWSAVLANLSGYAGKTFRLEFTTSHCSAGRHFVYAFIHLNEAEETGIQGNAVCNGMSGIRLKAPVGLRSYRWYDAGFSQLLGQEPMLNFSSLPAPGTKYACVVSADAGCEDTLYTTIRRVNADLDFAVNSPLRGCYYWYGVNLTTLGVSGTSAPDVSLNYFSDSNATRFMPSADQCRESGRYFVEASNDSGCRLVKPIDVVVYQRPALKTPDSVYGCTPNPIDLTLPQITAGSDTGIVLSYPVSMQSTDTLKKPAAIADAGLYFIRATNAGGCETINFVYADFARLRVNRVMACGPASLLSPEVTAGSSSGFSFSYWTDTAATNPLSAPDSVTQSGTYYIKGTQASGCSVVKPVPVSIFQPPVFAVQNPAPVVFPTAVDLLSTIQSNGPLRYSYWKDSSLRTAVPYPHSVIRGGLYYIKATNSDGCAAVMPVLLTVLPPAPVSVTAPNAFSPNGDGINDRFQLKVVSVQEFGRLQIFNRWGQPVFEGKHAEAAWDGTCNGQPQPTGTYYWVLEGTDTYGAQKIVKTGAVTLVR